MYLRSLGIQKMATRRPMPMPTPKAMAMIPRLTMTTLTLIPIRDSLDLPMKPMMTLMKTRPAHRPRS
jgi:hypothetical protein